MISASISGIAGAILKPILPQLVLDKVLGPLWDYLSSDGPSSSAEVDKRQQLENEREALEEANLRLKILQSEIRRLHKRDKQNMRVVLMNNKLRDVGYEIQDLESDLEYMEQQRRVEEINLKEDEAQMSQSRTRKRWSWSFWTTGQSSDHKRRRLSASESLKLSTDDVLNKMRSIRKHIQRLDSEMNTEIKVDMLFNEIALNGVYDPWEHHQVVRNQKLVTTSSVKERKIYGRRWEIERLTKVLTEPNVKDKVSVVSVYGMGGIGKTTLAQCVFNSREIEEYFDKKAWVCVSDNYDRFRIIKEIIDSLCINRKASFQYDTTSLDLLETKLQKSLKKKKFLLVLDDVWSDEWQQLLDPLRSAKVEIVKILVTCRDPKVAGRLDMGNQIFVEGLFGEDYWSFFVNCVFGDKNPDNYPQKLHDIGEQIVKKLKGSPLAGKTVGKLLGRSLTEKHWKGVLESDLWELENNAHDIMSALALSYYHLPQHLQLCFAFCSVFPKDFTYDRNSVIDMWIAHGYIRESGSSSKTMQDTGKEYFHELRAMHFFQGPTSSFQMHDLMHDLAQLVSQGEIYIYKDGESKNIPKNVRHLCASSLINLGSIWNSTNLRTLVLYRAGDICAFLNHGAFKRIRVLIIFDANMQELPDAIADLKHLQYLDVKKTNIRLIPESLCVLYHLRVLKLPYLHILPSSFRNLINLQNWEMFEGNHTSSRLEYRVKREGGYVIAQLRNMNELGGELSIKGLENIDSMKEAMEANLKEKHNIKSLKLSWTGTVDSCKYDVQEKVLEGLEPHLNLNCLTIEVCMSSKLPSWFMSLAFQKLQTLKLNKCKKWPRLPAALGQLPSLNQLALADIENITIEGDDSVIEMFPSLRCFVLEKARVSFEGMSSSSSSSSSLTTTTHRKLFPRLDTLRVNNCDGVNGLPWPMLSALKYLIINASPGLQDQVPRCLQKLTSLSALVIRGLKIDTGAQQQLQGFLLPKLTTITIQCCENMAFLGAVLLGAPSLENLIISKCSPVSFPPLGHFPVLKQISLNEVEVIVEDEAMPLFPSLPILTTMIFQNMPPSSSSTSLLSPSLKELTMTKASVVFRNMPSLSVSLVFPSLKKLIMREASVVFQNMLSPGLNDKLPGCLNGLSSLTSLELTGAKIETFPAEVMATLHSLERLSLEDCNELISLEGLRALPSPTDLYINKCPKFRSFFMEEENTEQGVLLPNLREISIESCQDLESLPAWLPRLPSLNFLNIFKCPKVHSLPEGGLPSSLKILNIIQCDLGLIERCQREGSPDWLMIQHIPERNF